MMEVNVILSGVICAVAWTALIVAVYVYFSVSLKFPRPEVLTNTYVASAWYLDWHFFTPLWWWSLSSCVWTLSERQWFLAVLSIVSMIFLGIVAAELLPSNRRQIKDRPPIGPQYPLDGMTLFEKIFLGNSIREPVQFLAAATTLAVLHVGWKWYAALFVCILAVLGSIVWAATIVFWIGWKYRRNKRQPLAENQILQRNVQLQAENRQLQERVNIDGLTGLASRVRFDEFLTEQFATSVKSQPLSLMMLDLDKFNSINDHYGQQTGDIVLASVAAKLLAAGRASDMAARYEGERMVLLLVGTSRATAAAIAEAIRRSIGNGKIQSDSGSQLNVTVSIGVATAERGSPLSTPALLIKAVDMAVHAAKRNGRNCVKVVSFPPAEAA